MSTRTDLNLNKVVNKNEGKLSADQQKSWAKIVMANLGSKLKATSINQILWKDNGNKK